MATQSDPFVVIRIHESTRKRLKVKAARQRKPVYQLVEEISKISATEEWAPSSGKPGAP